MSSNLCSCIRSSIFVNPSKRGPLKLNSDFPISCDHNYSYKIANLMHVMITIDYVIKNMFLELRGTYS